MSGPRAARLGEIKLQIQQGKQEKGGEEQNKEVLWRENTVNPCIS